MTRLSSKTPTTQTIKKFQYDRSKLKPGIMHFGPGMFHRAHQAFFTDHILNEGQSEWAIEGVELRDHDYAQKLNEQDGLYTLIVRGSDHDTFQIIGSILHVLYAEHDAQKILDKMTDPDIKIFSLTVTEKGYCLSTATGRLDINHPDIQHDLKNPHNPKTVIGYLVEGLSRRREKTKAAITVLSCDNLSENGTKLKNVVLDFAAERDPELKNWIESNVPFPCTMVDRITPKATDKTVKDASTAIGADDLCAVETEPFAQWVIEDNFANGRPDWDKAPQVLFVKDVLPYEDMKLRMLNGSHSLLAYLGFSAGLKYVQDVMKNENFAKLVKTHMMAASRTLAPVPGIKLEDYADQLCERFENKSIFHETYQIAMDGTQKLPQRIFTPAVIALKAGEDAKTYAVAVAAWMYYVAKGGQKDAPYAIRDPREDELKECVQNIPFAANEICKNLMALPHFVPAELLQNKTWLAVVEDYLDTMIKQGAMNFINQIKL